MTDQRRIAAMASETAQEPQPPGEGASVPKKRVNMLQRSLVLSLRQLQPTTSHKAIAEAVGISESSVARILAMQVTDVRQSTEALMQTGVLERLEDWSRASRLAAKKGYHQPAKDWLEAAKVIEPKPTATTSVNVAPTVVLNMPFPLGAIGPPAPPAIEAEAVPVLPPKEPTCP